MKSSNRVKPTRKNRKKLFIILVLVAVAIIGIVWFRIKTDRSNPDNYPMFNFKTFKYERYDFEYEGQLYSFNREDSSWVWIKQLKQDEPNAVIPETVEFYGKEYPVKGLAQHINYHDGKKMIFDTLTVPPGIEMVLPFAMESADLKKLIFTGKNERQINDNDIFIYGNIDEIECLSEEPGNIRFYRSEVKKLTVPKGCLDVYKEAYGDWLPNDVESVERD